MKHSSPNAHVHARQSSAKLNLPVRHSRIHTAGAASGSKGQARVVQHHAQHKLPLLEGRNVRVSAAASAGSLSMPEEAQKVRASMGPALPVISHTCNLLSSGDKNACVQDIVVVGCNMRQRACPDLARARSHRLRPSVEGHPVSLCQTSTLNTTSEHPTSSPMPQGSTVTQAVFNVVNVMMGVGLLSLPFALKSSGWIGIGLLWLMGFVANYTGQSCC